MARPRTPPGSAASWATGSAPIVRGTSLPDAARLQDGREQADRRQVLITRPEADGAETAQLVAARGFDPVLAPMLQVRPGVLAGAARFDAILLTSRNAVPALPPAWRTIPVLAVGGATAARARAAGFLHVRDADGDAADLATLVRRECAPGARLLLAHGRGQGRALQASLAAAGFRVQRRCAYAMVRAAAFPEAAAAALETGGVCAALFLSAETARAFVRLLPQKLRGALAGVDAVAIGRPAADALAHLPWHHVRVSVRPTLDHVLGLL